MDGKWTFLEPWWGVLRDAPASIRCQPRRHRLRLECVGISLDATLFPDSFSIDAGLQRLRDALELLLLFAWLDRPAFLQQAKKYCNVRFPYSADWADIDEQIAPPLVINLTASDDIRLLEVLITPAPLERRDSLFQVDHASMMRAIEQNGELDLDSFEIEVRQSTKEDHVTSLKEFESAFHRKHANPGSYPFRWRSINYDALLSTPNAIAKPKTLLQSQRLQLHQLGIGSRARGTTTSLTDPALPNATTLVVTPRELDSSMVIPLWASVLHMQSLETLVVTSELVFPRMSLSVDRCVWRWLWYALFSADAHHDQLWQLELYAVPAQAIEWLMEMVNGGNTRTWLTGVHDDFKPDKHCTTGERRRVRVVATAKVYSILHYEVSLTADALLAQSMFTFDVLQYDHEAVCVAVPGYGPCWVRIEDVHAVQRVEEAPSAAWKTESHSIRSLSLSQSNVRDAVHPSGYGALLQLIGRPLESLELGFGAHVEVDLSPLMDTIWQACPRLKHLKLVNSFEISIDHILQGYERQLCRVASLEIHPDYFTSDTGQSCLALALALSNTTSSVARHLRELWISWEFTHNEGNEGNQDDGLAMDSVLYTAFATMLSSNRTLEYLALGTNDGRVQQPVRAMFDSLPETWIAQPHPPRFVLALLSVVHACVNGTPHVAVSGNEQRLLAQFDTWMLRLVLEFAAPSVKRIIVFKEV